MARIRYLKPEFFKDEKIAEYSFAHRLLFQGLWVLADREGRLEDRPKWIKIEVFPYEEKLKIDEILNDLSSGGFIVRYEVNSKRYIQIKNFLKHQKPHHTERASEIPQMPINGELTVKKTLCDGENPVGMGNGEEKEKEKEEILVEQVRPEAVGEHKIKKLDSLKKQSEEIFTYWQEIRGHPKSKLDGIRLKAVMARLKEGYTVDRIKQAIRGINFSPHHMGQNDRNTVYDDIELICRSGAKIDKFADLEGEDATGRKNFGNEFKGQSKQETRIAKNLEAIRAYGERAGVIERGNLHGGDRGVVSVISESGDQPGNVDGMENASERLNGRAVSGGS